MVRHPRSTCPRSRTGSWFIIKGQEAYMSPDQVPVEFDNIWYFVDGGGPPPMSGWRWIVYRERLDGGRPLYVKLWNILVWPFTMNYTNPPKRKELEILIV